MAFIFLSFLPYLFNKKKNNTNTTLSEYLQNPIEKKRRKRQTRHFQHTTHIPGLGQKLQYKVTGLNKYCRI
jgi:hypothetical protein